MNNLLIALFAYSIDRVFGEFTFVKHPVSYMGDLIGYFEHKFYRDSVLRGCMLVLFVLLSTLFVSQSITLLLESLGWMQIIVSSVIASMFLAHRMLYDAVKDILDTEDKRGAIAMLVSRDTEQMDDADIYKASIETYAENLSDGVIAPLLYLILFGLNGIIVYKAINTMDSMVGYKNRRYLRYGKVAAKLDDIANFIPSRITAVMIMLLAKQKKILSFYHNGRKHESPNAGHPITAMAQLLGVALGGDTYYFGKLKKKAYFGEGRREIEADDLRNALLLRNKIDISIIILLLLAIIILSI